MSFYSESKLSILTLLMHQDQPFMFIIKSKSNSVLIHGVCLCEFYRSYKQPDNPDVVIAEDEDDDSEFGAIKRETAVLRSVCLCVKYNMISKTVLTQQSYQYVCVLNII